MNDRNLLALIGAWILATILYFATPVSLIQYLSVTGLLFVATVTYYVSERGMLTEFAQSQQSGSGEKAIYQLDLDRVEKTLEEHSERHYSDDDEINIRWDLTDYDTANLDSKGEEALIAVNGALGQNDRKIQVFIHIPSYNIPTHKRIRAGTHQEKYPFKYCDYYQENKSGQSENLQQLAQNNYPPYFNGPRMAPNSQFTGNQGQNSDDGEE